MSIGRQMAAVALLAVIAAIAAPWLLSDHWLGVAVFTLVFAYIASTWNIMAGLARLISLGHMTFVGIGAYASTYFYLEHGVTPWLGMVLGSAGAASLALLIGTISYRMGVAHMSLALLTLVINQAAFVIFLNWQAVGGASGLRIDFEPGLMNMQFQTATGYFYLALIFCVAIVCFTIYLRHHRVGQRLAAVRENERVAESLGVPLVRYKLIATVVSAALAAPGGTLLAQYTLFTSPESTMGVFTSLEITIYAIVGGLASAVGPLVGTIILYPLADVLRGSFAGLGPGLDRAIFGVALVLVAIFAPTGIVGFVAGIWHRIRRIRARVRRRDDLAHPAAETER